MFLETLEVAGATVLVGPGICSAVWRHRHSAATPRCRQTSQPCRCRFLQSRHQLLPEDVVVAVVRVRIRRIRHFDNSVNTVALEPACTAVDIIPRVHSATKRILADLTAALCGRTARSSLKSFPTESTLSRISQTGGGASNIRADLAFVLPCRVTALQPACATIVVGPRP